MKLSFTKNNDVDSEDIANKVQTFENIVGSSLVQKLIKAATVKCKKCGNKIASNKKVPISVTRFLKNAQFYETPVSARRHLSKPLCRMDLD